MNPLLMLIIGILAGGAGALVLLRAQDAAHGANPEALIEEAKTKAKELKERAQNKTANLKEAFEREEKSTKEGLEQSEKIIAEKEKIVEGREERHEQYQKSVQNREDELKKLESTAEELLKESVQKLSQISKLSEEEALEQAKTELKALIEENKEKRTNSQLEEYEDELPRHATAVLQVVIQRLGVVSSVDKNSTAVKIKDDRFKGMLIGKEGKNVAYLEELLPVSIIFNQGGSDTIYVGGLNLFRRHIAKRAIQKLELAAKKTGKITHEMIKGAVEAAEANLMKQADDKGRWAMKQMNIDPSGMPEELINYTGRLYFRTSYGQNIIHHSLEMAYAARLIAELIGSDVETAMLAAFFHDIGKAIDHDIGGAHDDISKDILEKHKYPNDIVHAAYAHHDKVPCIKPADFIVKAVDAISGGRPGARMESVTNYFERMKQLEDAAQSFKGVKKVYTMAAGREVRVILHDKEVNDEAMQPLAGEIAEKISEEIAFPGIIKVNLIRRTRSTSTAQETTRSH